MKIIYNNKKKFLKSYLRMWVLQEGPLLGTRLGLDWTRDLLLALDLAVLYCCFPSYTPVHQLINNNKIYFACLFVCPFVTN